MRALLGLLVMLVLCLPLQAVPRAVQVYGRVLQAGSTQPLEGVVVQCGTTRLYATTDSAGYYRLAVPRHEEGGVVIKAQLLGFAPDSVVLHLPVADSLRADFALYEEQQHIQAVTIAADGRKRGSIELLGIESLSVTGGAAGGGLENVLKVLPGVQSNNELSSQYSVRGGSFDENLVYVNGVEIYRQMLIRTGQQEGLSAINPQLVSSVEFSTGGFGAEYGDKLSSVLNVKYRRPTGFAGRVEASLLGASAAVDYAGLGGKLSGTTGIRYKRATYLLGTLDTRGQYNPTFADVQSNLTYQVNSRLQLNILGLAASNIYDFVPENRNTTFGTLANPVDFTVYYEGHERNQYQNLIGGLSAHYQVNSDVQLSLSVSGVWLAEQEQLDILSEYWLSDLEHTPDKGNMMVGSARDHARNHRYTQVSTWAHSGVWHHAQGALKWGVQLKQEQVDDAVHQWQLLDSAGYMVPRYQGQLRMKRFVAGDNHWDNYVVGAYVQENYGWEWGSHRWRLTPGMRLSYVHLSGQWLVSPRMQLQWYPRGGDALQYYLATGVYQQPAYLQEAKQYDFENNTVTLNKSLKAQQSVHVVLGSSTLLRYQHIPVKLTMELFYKQLRNMVGYRQDNVALIYSGRNNARGYTYGLDLRLNAELLPGTESWLGVSLMQAKQRVLDASYINPEGVVVQPGYFPMANDQLINISVMGQDKVLNWPWLRAYLLLNYGSSLPSFVPSDNRYDNYFRMPSYFRVDMGFSFVLFDATVKSGLGRKLPFMQSCIFTLEALNIFDVTNTSSYLWVSLVGSAGQGVDRVAVPNYLTPLRLNGKIALSF